MASEALKVSTE
jgi:hypothetical protein